MNVKFEAKKNLFNLNNFWCFTGKISLVLFAIFFSISAYAGVDIFKSSSIKCVSNRGSATIASFSQPDWSTKEINEEASYVFDHISYKNNKARLIGNKGSNDVQIFKGNIGITIIDNSDNIKNPLSAGKGFITLFVISPVDLDGKGYPLVESRVIYESVTPSFAVNATLGSQYFGYCKPI